MVSSSSTGRLPAALPEDGRGHPGATAGEARRGGDLACRVNDGSGWWIVLGESLMQSDDCLQGQTIAKRRSSRRDGPRRQHRHLRSLAPARARLFWRYAKDIIFGRRHASYVRSSVRIYRDAGHTIRRELRVVLHAWIFGRDSSRQHHRVESTRICARHANLNATWFVFDARAAEMSDCTQGPKCPAMRRQLCLIT